jgi:hypothetical protein
MRGKHCEFVKPENGASAIACGAPDRCDHDDKGAFYYLFKNKKTGKVVRVNADDAEDCHTRNSVIIGASGSCSKCGALSIDYTDRDLI